MSSPLQKNKIDIDFFKRFNIDNQLKTIYWMNDPDTRVVFYSGGAGSGKSRILTEMVNWYCLKYAGCRVALCRDVRLSLEASTLRTFWAVVEDYGLKDTLMNNYNKTTGDIVYPNGSSIKLTYLGKSLADPEYSRLGSLEFTMVAIDELSQTIEPKAFDMMMTRIRYKLKEFDLTPKMLIASNPSMSWVRNRFYIPYREGKLDKRIKFLTSKTTDNPNLPSEYLQQFDFISEVDRSRLLDGSWENISEELDLMSMENLNALQCIPENLNDNRPAYMTIDVASMGSDRSCIIVWKGYNAIKMKVLKHANTQELLKIANEFKTKYNINSNRIIVDSIGVGTGLSDLLVGSVKFIANQKAPNDVFNSLKDQCVYHIAEIIKKGELTLPSDGAQWKDTIVLELNAHKKIVDSTKMKVTPKAVIRSRIGISPDVGDAIIFRAYWDIQPSANFRAYHRKVLN